jgi:hypothetical protein
MPDHVIGVTGELHRHTRLPLRPAGLRPDLLRTDQGAGLASPSDDGGLLEFFEFWFTRAAWSATCP